MWISLNWKKSILYAYNLNIRFKCWHGNFSSDHCSLLGLTSKDGITWYDVLTLTFVCKSTMSCIDNIYPWNRMNKVTKQRKWEIWDLRQWIFRQSPSQRYVYNCYNYVRYRITVFFCGCKFLRLVSKIGTCNFCDFIFCDFTPWQSDFYSLDDMKKIRVNLKTPLF